MNNDIIIECEMKLRTYSQISAIAPLKFRNGQVISFHTLSDIRLFIPAPCSS